MKIALPKKQAIAQGVEELKYHPPIKIVVYFKVRL